MNKLFISILAGIAVALPLTTISAPDEVQQQLIQRAQEARKKLNAAQAAQATERKRMMEEHMQMMRQAMVQMKKAKPREGMSPQQMKEWISEHLNLMELWMGQMMDEHHMMLEGMGKS